jgi:hypothetical protein
MEKIMKFKNWLENTDIFGFEKDITKQKDQKLSDTPIKRFDLEKMMECLAERNLNGKIAKSLFINQIQWGEGVGAVKIWSGTGLQIGIERLGINLESRPVWVMKKFFQVNRAGYGGHEDKVAKELFEYIESIDRQPIDSPKKEYNDLEKLVVNTANKLRRSANDIFIYEGIKKVSPNNYIIKMELRGHGVERRHQQRVIQNVTDMSYNPQTGVIRLINANVENHVGGSVDWTIMPSDMDWNFFPTQSGDEIADTITTNIKWY